MLGIFKKREEINYKELIRNGAVIIDVRSKEEFESGHVKGAANIPLDLLSSRVYELGKKDAFIITCCRSGGRSAMAQNILQKAGYYNVHNGGGWQILQAKLQ
jgi:rhodanese-related sulfurtransferase